MVTTAEVRVPVPPPQVRPRLHGLLTTFPAGDLDAHKRLGVTWPGSGACGGGTSTASDRCLDNTSVEAMWVMDACLEMGTADRVTIYTGLRRSIADSLGGDLVPDPQSIFAHAEAPAVEGAFWDAAYAGAAATDPAESLLDALSLVEQDLAENYAGLGVIHVSPRVAVLLGDALVSSSGQLTTRIGTPVVIGAGYGGLSGGGLSIIGTGMPYLAKASEPTRVESYNTATNDQIMYFQRTWLVGYDCHSVISTYTPPTPPTP